MSPVDEKEAALRREISELEARYSSEFLAVKAILEKQEKAREAVRLEREGREKINARKRREERQAITFENPRVRLVLQFIAMLIAAFASQHR